MRFHFQSLLGAAAALALCASPTIASAATSTAFQPVSPLVAVSVFGTQASAQAVCTGSAAAASAAGAAVVQAQPNCVLPVADAAPPPVSDAVAPPPPAANFGIPPVLLALAGLALVGGILAAMSEDDDDEARFPPTVPISP